MFKKPTEGLFFLKAFLDSTLKEWGGIDHLRSAHCLLVCPIELYI